MAIWKTLLTFLILNTLLGTEPVKSQVFKDTDTTWSGFKFLIGEWSREENGQPNLPEVKFSFTADLKGKVLIRRTNAEDPDTGKTRRPLEHGDILIIYSSTDGKPVKAINFDDKGHTINYAVAIMKNGEVVLTSALFDSSPRYRVTYRPIKSDLIKVKMEATPPGKPSPFTLLYEGNCIRIK